MPAGVVDRFEWLTEVAGERVGGGDDVRPGLDLHGAVAAGGPYELADGPAGVAFDPAADRERGEDDGQVGFDRVPGAVVDGPDLRATAGTRTWYPALKSAGITPSRDTVFHQLRHHFASSLLASSLLAGGVDVNAIAIWLGHSSAAVTLRHYAHLMPDTADRMRAAVNAALAGETALSASIARS